MVLGLSLALLLAGAAAAQAALSPTPRMAGVLLVEEDAQPPRYAPYFPERRGKGGSTRSGPPEAKEDFEPCTDERKCNVVTFMVGFKDGCPDPDNILPSVPNCLTGNDTRRCTATEKGRYIVFGRERNGTHPFLVRFSPFGDPIKVNGLASERLRIDWEAPVAWYKFTVYTDDHGPKKCLPVDPTVIVTK
jgi:hypothetical protein